MVHIRSDVSEKYIVPFFRVIDSDSHWFAARIYLTADREESLLQRYLHCRVCITVEV
jgi:hypothetical protein